MISAVDELSEMENRIEPAERPRQSDGEHQEQREHHGGERRIEMKEQADGQHRGEKPAGEVHQPVADHLPNLLGVGHDAADERPALGGLERRDRQAQHPRLETAAQLGDGTVGRLADHLRGPERSHRFDRDRSSTPRARSARAARSADGR